MHARVTVAMSALVAAIALGVAIGWWLYEPETRPAGQWHQRQLVYVLDVRNEMAEPRTDKALRVFVPPDIEGRQRLIDVHVDRPVEIRDAPGGNVLAEIDLGTVPPYGARHVRVRMELEVRDYAYVDEARMNGQMDETGSSRFPVDHPDVAARAGQLAADDDAETMRGIHAWVDNHMEDIGYVRRDRGALYALHEAKGDCTEYMSLTSALARSAGVRVRALGGFVYDQDRVARAGDFHNWTEALIDDQWWVVDPLFGDFTGRTDGHVVVRDLTSPATTRLGSQGLFLPLDGFDVRML